MKKTFFAAAAFSVVLAVAGGAYAQAGDGWLSRYWDGCKPSCSWSGKQYNGQGQCKECDKNNNKMNTSDGNRSSCDGGTSYTCWDMSPWSISATEAYGFAAAHRDQQCGTCWELTFKGTTEHQGNGDASVLRGKKLTVMISNIGGDVAGNQLDFLVPGGGVGAFDAFSSQIGVSISALGEKYGGLVSAGCQGNPTCLKGKCDQVFGKSGQEWLKAGCYFYADWMGAIGNPQYNAKSVTCPAALTDRWKNAAAGTPGGNGGGNPTPTPTPTPTTFTLTTNVNPAGGGSVTRNPNANSYNSGASVTVTATASQGYTFTGWSGASTSTNASVTVTMNGNLTLTANFQPNTFTLTTSVSPQGGGTVSRNPNANSYNSGTQVTVTATAAQGYTFTGWSGASTAATASVTINMNADRTLTANFQQNSTGGGNPAPATYTLTTNVNPTGGGTVSRNPAGPNYNAGTQVTVTATAAQGYTFTGWSGASAATTSGVTVTMNGNLTLTANFQQVQQTYTLTTNVYPSGGGSVSRSPAGQGSGGLSHASGTTVTLTATPATGYTFLNWTGEGVASANNATTTVSMTANRTVTANFQQQGNNGNGGGNNTNGDIKLTIKIEPVNSGRVDVTPKKDGYQQQEPITVTAVANEGYAFDRWDGDDLVDSEPTKSTVMWWHRTITARFKQSAVIKDTVIYIPGGSNPPVGSTPPSGSIPPGGPTEPGNGGSAARTDTAYIEAEDYASKSGAFTVEDKDGVTNIGNIDNGHSATYKVTVAKSGAFTLGFRLATNQNNCAFTVSVNGAAAGSVTSNNTGGWYSYRLVFLSGDVNLNEGVNTIVLNFQTPVNIDYLMLLGEPGSSPSLTPVRYSAATAIKARASVTLKPTARGFTATLPAGHGFTSYRVINMQGREIKSGRIGGSETNLSVGGLKHSVVFLRLEGKGQTPLSLKVVTY